MDSLKVPTIPKPLNEPLKMSKFTVNELCVVGAPIVVLWALGSLLIGVIVGIIMLGAYKALSNTPYGDITRKGIYWFFPASKSKYKFLLPSHIREIIG